MTFKKAAGTGIELSGYAGFALTAFGVATGGLGLVGAGLFTAYDAGSIYVGRQLKKDSSSTPAVK